MIIVQPIMNNYSTFIKTPKAVALKYDKKTDVAPKVVASGKGVIAEEIMKIAMENNIPLHQDADLVQILSFLEINEHIPVEVYGVVANILSYIYKKNDELKKSKI